MEKQLHHRPLSSEEMIGEKIIKMEGGKVQGNKTLFESACMNGNGAW